MPQSSTATATALALALSTLAACDIQITQPASKATTLALQPNPVLHWVYTSSDPKLVGITVRQVEDDLNYEPTLMISRGGTPVSLGSIPIPLNTVKFKPDMNITIAITELTEENQNDPYAQKILVSRGPLRLVEGSNSVEPVDTATDTSTTTASTSETTSTAPAASSKSSTTSSSSSPSSSSASSSSTDEASATEDPASSPTNEGGAAATISSSDADKYSIATVLYVTMMALTAVPAFLFGFTGVTLTGR